MKRRDVIRCLTATPLLAASGGCAGFRRIFTGSSDELVQDARAVFFRGYRNTVTAKTQPEKIVELFKTPEGVMKWGIFQSVKFMPGTEDFSRAGGKARIKMRVGGIDWNILFTNIHSTEDNGAYELWFGATYPTVHVQKWRFSPAPGGTEVNLRFFGDPPKVWGTRELSSWTELIDIFTALFDNALTNLMSLNDPDFNADEFLKKGGSGEIFDVIFQRYYIETGIEASGNRIFDYLRHSDGFATLLGGGARPDCLSDPDADVCPFSGEVGTRKIDFNSFMVDYKPSRFMHRLLSWSDYVSSVEIKADPDVLGNRSRFSASYVMELPSPASALSLDLTIGISRLPERMRREVEKLKAGIETAPA